MHHANDCAEDQLALGLERTPAAPVELEAAAEKLRARAERKNTSKAYRIAWDSFKAFCKTADVRALPAGPKIVCDYLTHLRLEGRAIKTIRQHKAAIRNYHIRALYLDPSKDPLVTTLWEGMLREAEAQGPKTSLALWRRAVERVIDRIETDLRAHGKFPPEHVRLASARDRALILLISSSARLTTSEVQNLLAEEIIPDSAGLQLRVRRSPDDFVNARIVTVKYGSGKYCPVAALREWLHITELDREDASGAIFRAIDHDGHFATQRLGHRHILGIVKRRCALANLTADSISLRSLRAGSMLQGGYDGEEPLDVLESAGLGVESLVHVRELVERGRNMRDRREIPPDGLYDVSPLPERSSAFTIKSSRTHRTISADTLPRGRA